MIFKELTNPFLDIHRIEPNDQGLVNGNLVPTPYVNEIRLLFVFYVFSDATNSRICFKLMKI